MLDIWKSQKPQWIFTYLTHKETELKDQNSYLNEEIVQYKVDFKSPRDFEPISESNELWSRELIN